MRRARAGWPLAVALAAAAVWFAACASERQAARGPTITEVAPQQTGETQPTGPHGEIERLAHEIDTQRLQMALPELAPAPACEQCTATPMSEPVTVASDAQCHPGQSTTCHDSCTLSDSICGNAAKICDLAAGLPDDGWAAQHCTSAKQTCDAAHAKCCACAP